MKRKKETSTLGTVASPIIEEDIADYDSPIANVTVESLDYFIGQLFTHTELLGLPERQLAAYRSTVREMFWKWYNNHLPNPHGYSDPSHQARVRAVIEQYTTTTAR